jgi:hypothetical protein
LRVLVIPEDPTYDRYILKPIGWRGLLNVCPELGVLRRRVEQRLAALP